MIRSDHLFYDLRKSLGSPKLMGLVLAVASIFILFVSFSLLYIFIFASLFVAMFVARGLIGRRCPKCDGPLKETGAERDKKNVFVIHITWRCPRDGYEEKEETTGDSGLFGVK